MLGEDAGLGRIPGTELAWYPHWGPEPLVVKSGRGGCWENPESAAQKGVSTREVLTDDTTQDHGDSHMWVFLSPQALTVSASFSYPSGCGEGCGTSGAGTPQHVPVSQGLSTSALLTIGVGSFLVEGTILCMWDL